MSGETEREIVLKLLRDMDAFIRTGADERVTRKRELMDRYAELINR